MKLMRSLGCAALFLMGLLVMVAQTPQAANATTGSPTIAQTIYPNPDFPHGVSADGTNVWVVTNGMVDQYDATNGFLSHLITIPQTGSSFLSAIYSDGTSVYVVQRDDGGDSYLHRINCATASEDAAPIDLGGGMGSESVTADTNYVWVGNLNGSSVSKIDKTAWTLSATIPGLNQVTGVYSDGTTVWVADGGLKRIDIATSGVTDITDPSFSGVTQAVTGGAGQIWVTGWSTAYSIDPSTNAILSSVSGLNNIRSIALNSGILWAAQGFSMTVSQIDAAAATITGSIDSSTFGYGINVLYISADSNHAWALAVDGNSSPVLYEINPGVTVPTTTPTSSSPPTTAGPTTSVGPPTTGSSTTTAAVPLAITGSGLVGPLVLAIGFFGTGIVLLARRRSSQA